MPPTNSPPHPRIIGAQRFFSRSRTFDCECPHCGRVYRVRYDTASSTWNPRTARFTCGETGGCGYQYTVGMLFWPVPRHHSGKVPPADQVPGPRQLAQLRAEGESWWLPEQYRHKGRPDPTNLTGEPDRPEPEDPIDLELLDADPDRYECLTCGQVYNPLKSKAKRTDRYCSVTCEDRERERNP